MKYIDAPTQSITAVGSEFLFRTMGIEKEIPIIFLNHLAGTLDDWDPEVVEGVSTEHYVITFDNKGVGGSGGQTPLSVMEMADDAIQFIKSLGYNKVDLLGFSLGGAIAQQITLKNPSLVRKLVLAGTGPAGGIGIGNIRKLAYKSQLKSLFTFKDIRTFLFFTRTPNGKNEARKFIQRVSQRKHDPDKKISLQSFFAQLTAIDAYANQPEFELSEIDIPVLIANGEDDIMVPSINSAHMLLQIPNSKLCLYKDAGHGGVFQHFLEFVPEVLEFLKS